MDNNSRPIYLLIVMLFFVIAIEGYYIYDLKKQNTASMGSLVTHSSYAPQQSTIQNIDPFVQMQKIQQQMMQNFASFNAMFADDPLFQDAFLQISVSPISDVKESVNAYTIELNIPGADESKIDIKTEANRVSVSAVSERRSDTNSSNFIHREFYSQHFQRTFTLPVDADTDALRSEYDRGILKLTIPKKAND